MPKKKSVTQKELLEQVLSNSLLLQTKLTDVTTKLTRLVKIFETASKEVTKQEPESIGNIVEKLDKLERQNKAIAKTLRLFEVYLREDLKPKVQPQPIQKPIQPQSTFQSPFLK
ncbi:hypothetical protein CL618_02455 [archaeon]|nr:hypothetical protein [archaeon]|tara:strand:- start:2942 stop:3283 length:342 start_codon:yes stop_codon:yes gene_type:complete